MKLGIVATCLFHVLSRLVSNPVISEASGMMVGAMPSL